MAEPTPRQGAGHVRVAVYCASTVQLKILRNFLGNAVGDVFLFAGHLTATQRTETIDGFLGCERGVILLSSAGSVGINLHSGCEVLILCGALPWTSVEIDQTIARIWRLGQQRPVEILQLEARRSVTSAKLALHKDKRERLEKSTRDRDYSGFLREERQTWRLASKTIAQLTPVDEFGNFESTAEAIQKARDFETLCERCDAQGVQRPPRPLGLDSHPKLARRIILPAPLTV